MKTHTLDSPFFEQIVKNEKKYEIRIFDEKRKNSCQEIIFFSKKKDTMTQLKKKFQNRRFLITSEKHWNQEDFREAVPSIETVEDGVQL